MKMSLGLFFALCALFAVAVFGSSDSDRSRTQNANLNQSKKSEMTLVLERLEELEKSREELKEQLKLWKGEVEELKRQMREVRAVRLLAPHLRGPPGKPGEKEPVDPRSLQSCRDVLENTPTPHTKKQTIYPHANANATSLEVLCDFETDGGGWTLIQKRSSGPKQEFNQNWTEYASGFGSLDKNFWLGLENIRALTENGNHELRIELEDFEGNKSYAQYSRFSISDASDFYRLSIGGFSGDSTAGDSMTNSNIGSVNNGMRFSTKDVDNDKHTYENCAMDHGGVGGWWFHDCGYSVLNGLYFEKGETTEGWKGIYWHSWKGWSTSLAKSEMKIRKRK